MGMKDFEVQPPIKEKLSEEQRIKKIVKDAIEKQDVECVRGFLDLNKFFQLDCSNGMQNIKEALKEVELQYKKNNTECYAQIRKMLIDKLYNVKNVYFNMAAVKENLYKSVEKNQLQQIKEILNTYPLYDKDIADALFVFACKNKNFDMVYFLLYGNSGKFIGFDLDISQTRRNVLRYQISTWRIQKERLQTVMSTLNMSCCPVSDFLSTVKLSIVDNYTNNDEKNTPPKDKKKILTKKRATIYYVSNEEMFHRAIEKKDSEALEYWLSRPLALNIIREAFVNLTISAELDLVKKILTHEALQSDDKHAQHYIVKAIKTTEDDFKKYKKPEHMAVRKMLLNHLYGGNYLPCYQKLYSEIKLGNVENVKNILDTYYLYELGVVNQVFEIACEKQDFNMVFFLIKGRESEKENIFVGRFFGFELDINIELKQKLLQFLYSWKNARKLSDGKEKDYQSVVQTLGYEMALYNRDIPDNMRIPDFAQMSKNIKFSGYKVKKEHEKSRSSFVVDEYQGSDIDESQLFLMHIQMGNVKEAERQLENNNFTPEVMKDGIIRAAMEARLESVELLLKQRFFELGGKENISFVANVFGDYKIESHTGIEAVLSAYIEKCQEGLVSNYKENKADWIEISDFIGAIRCNNMTHMMEMLAKYTFENAVLQEGALLAIKEEHTLIVKYFLEEGGLKICENLEMKAIVQKLSALAISIQNKDVKLILNNYITKLNQMIMDIEVRDKTPKDFRVKKLDDLIYLKNQFPDKCGNLESSDEEWYRIIDDVELASEPQDEIKLEKKELVLGPVSIEIEKKIEEKGREKEYVFELKELECEKNQKDNSKRTSLDEASDYTSFLPLYDMKNKENLDSSKDVSMQNSNEEEYPLDEDITIMVDFNHIKSMEKLKI